jgi:hypothetical protein
MFLYNYVSSYFNENNTNKEEKKDDFDDFQKIGLVTMKDLQSVSLQPIVPLKNNNTPCFKKIDLRNLNRAQLDCILNVKLKPIPPKMEEVRKYEVRHPCLRELLQKRNVIN